MLGASTNYLLFLAFDLRLSFLAALFLLVVLMAGVSVPSVPGRFGVFHYLTVISLASIWCSKGSGSGVRGGASFNYLFANGCGGRLWIIERADALAVDG